MMAQQQITCGFTEAILQLDEHTIVRVHNRLQPEIELTSSGRTLSLSKTQWDQLQYLSTNITLAFTLLAEGKIDPINDGKNKKRRTDDAFDELIDTLRL